MKCSTKAVSGRRKTEDNGGRFSKPKKELSTRLAEMKSKFIFGRIHAHTCMLVRCGLSSMVMCSSRYIVISYQSINIRFKIT